ncbi:hypothetical protein MTR_8g018470 [Medicago truncatula]|uniref:Uncharacterized protein n=1 Tax=Medicago truncatula TaxID=3880 RepID=G7LIA4_MEDTR|nr:hypothetical protein MTR_8g018470 [Medicago truncatula]
MIEGGKLIFGLEKSPKNLHVRVVLKESGRSIACFRRSRFRGGLGAIVHRKMDVCMNEGMKKIIEKDVYDVLVLNASPV